MQTTRRARVIALAAPLRAVVLSASACSPGISIPLPVTTGALVTVETRGGLCVDGPCGTTIIIERDGRIHEAAKPPNDIGTVPPGALAALDAAIGTTDFAALRSHPFTGECPTAFDGLRRPSTARRSCSSSGRRAASSGSPPARLTSTSVCPSSWPSRPPLGRSSRSRPPDTEISAPRPRTPGRSVSVHSAKTERSAVQSRGRGEPKARQAPGAPSRYLEVSARTSSPAANRTRRQSMGNNMTNWTRNDCALRR